MATKMLLFPVNTPKYNIKASAALSSMRNATDPFLHKLLRYAKILPSKEANLRFLQYLSQNYLQNSLLTTK